MDDSDLIEHTVASEPVYDGKLLHVRRDTVRLPNGHETVREWIAHPGAVVVLASGNSTVRSGQPRRWTDSCIQA